MATQTHEVKIPVTTVDKSSAVLQTITKEIKQAAEAGRVLQSVIGGFIGGFAAGAVRGLKDEIDKLAHSIVQLGDAAVEMKYLGEETRLSQEQIAKFQYGMDYLGISAGESQQVLTGLTGKLIDLRKLGLSPVYNELMRFQGGPELAETLRRQAQSGNIEGAIRTLVDRMKNARGGADARRELARIFGIPERLADLSIDKLPAIILQNIKAGEEFHRKWVDLRWTLGNMGTMIGNQLMPVFKELAEQLNDFLSKKETQDAIKDAIYDIGKYLSEVHWHELGDDIKGVGESFLSFGKNLKEVFDWISSIPPELRNMVIGAFIGGPFGAGAGLGLGLAERFKLLPGQEKERAEAIEPQYRKQWEQQHDAIRAEQQRQEAIREGLSKAQQGTQAYENLFKQLEESNKRLADMAEALRKLEEDLHPSPMGFEGLPPFSNEGRVIPAAFHPGATGGFGQGGPSVGQAPGGPPGPTGGPSTGTGPGPTGAPSGGPTGGQGSIAPSGAPPAGLPNLGSSQRVRELQGREADIRKGAISPTLRAQLDFAAQETGLEAHVTSGGQPAHGIYGRERTGSHRHDLGGAGDLRLWDPVAKRYLDMRNPQDAARMEEFVARSVQAGATGVGAGLGYMKARTMHIGGGPGPEGFWGGAPWIGRAYRRGVAMRNQFAADRAALDRMNGARAFGPTNMLGNAMVNVKVRSWDEATPSQQSFREIRMEKTPQMANSGADGGGWNNWSYE